MNSSNTIRKIAGACTLRQVKPQLAKHFTSGKALQVGVAVACAAVTTGLVYQWGPVALAPLLGALCCPAADEPAEIRAHSQSC